MLNKVFHFKYTLRTQGFVIDTYKFCTGICPSKSANINENDKKVKTKSPKITKSAELLTYINTQKDMDNVESLVSPHLLKIHRAVPESLYLVSSRTAKSIVKLIGEKLKGNTPVVEVNPGFGCLTKELLNNGINNITLYESSPHYEESLKKLRSEYECLNINIGDFFGMWRIEFQDKIDGGSRVENLFSRYEKSSNDEASMKIIGAIPSLSFVKYLIQCIVFQKGVMEVGRPELFLSLPPSSYFNLVPLNSDEENKVYRCIPVLFNVFCDMELIAKVPRKDFLPWQTDRIKTKNVKKRKIFDIDQRYLYLVNIKLKPHLPCKPEQLPLLWYFFKHHLLSKHNRIIPMLEQWIPGCGVWLITDQDPPGTNQKTSPNENDPPLPHMTIFTQFSDLTPAEKVTVFKKFISWPEFEHCPFQEAMDNHLAKNLSSYMDMKDETLEQDDDANESLT